MQFAVNYSPQTEALRSNGQVQLDRYKCPDWPDLIQTAREHVPVYVHAPLNAGRLAEVSWTALLELLEATETPYINLHLEARPADFPAVPIDSREPAHARRIIDHLVDGVRQVQAHAGGRRVIVENVIYRGPGGKALYLAVDPTVIRTVVRETGCGLLLDTAHARVTASYLGLTPQEYLAGFPTDALCEWHVTGAQEHDGRLRDHLPMSDADWALTEWAAEQIHCGTWSEPWVLALEYGGIGPIFAWRSEASVLAHDAPRLYRLVERLR